MQFTRRHASTEQRQHGAMHDGIEAHSRCDDLANSQIVLAYN